MVKINQGLSNFSEPEEKEQYQIVKVSEETQKGFKGVAISLEPKTRTHENRNTVYRITAWFGQGESVGTKSKLGSFVHAFAEYYESTGDKADKAIEKAQDTDNWQGHTVKILLWRNKNREITVIS